MNIYWSVYFNPIQKILAELNFSEPQNLYDTQILNEKIEGDPFDVDFRLCPSVKDLTKKIYTLKFPYDYTIDIERKINYVSSRMYDQNFFDQYVQLRSIESGLISFRLYYIFFSEEEVEAQTSGAYFSNNSFTNNTRIIPGKLNIGKWFRPLDCAFLINEGVNELVTNKGDDYCYVNFLTNEDITLKRFHMTDTLNKILAQNIDAKTYMKKRFRPLGYWYDHFLQSKQKSLILKEIKENLME